MTSPCPHHFRIAAPDQVPNPREGLPGVCVRCGETRTFRGNVEDPTRREWNTMAYARLTRRSLADEEVEAS